MKKSNSDDLNQINYRYFPSSKSVPEHLMDVIDKFRGKYHLLNPTDLVKKVSDYQELWKKYDSTLKKFENSPEINTLTSEQIEMSKKKIREEYDMNNEEYEKWQLESDQALNVIKTELESINYRVEKGKKGKDKIHVPVLYGRNGKVEKHFEADAYNERTHTVIEIESGRGVANNSFLKDLVEACLMEDVDYLVIAVKNMYYTKAGKTLALKGKRNFETVERYFLAMYSCDKLILPLKGVLIIGY